MSGIYAVHLITCLVIPCTINHGGCYKVYDVGYCMSLTTMKVRRETLDRLKRRGKMGDSFEDVVNRLLDTSEEPLEKGVLDEI